jgi:hypothetical protein
VVEGQPVLQNLHLVEVLSEPHFAKEEDAGFNERFTDHRPLFLGRQGPEDGYVKPGISVLQIQGGHHAAEAGANDQNIGFTVYRNAE